MSDALQKFGKGWENFWKAFKIFQVLGSPEFQEILELVRQNLETFKKIIELMVQIWRKYFEEDEQK